MTVHSSRNDGEKTGNRMPPVEHQFKPGNPGRPKGSRNKLGEAFIEDLHIAWEKHGMAAIEATIKNHPAQFLKVIAQVLPKDMNLHINPYDHMTDEQIMERLRVGLLEMRRQEYKDRFRISERRDCRIPTLTGGYPDFNCRKFALR